MTVVLPVSYGLVFDTRLRFSLKRRSASLFGRMLLWRGKTCCFSPDGIYSVKALNHEVLWLA